MTFNSLRQLPLQSLPPHLAVVISVSAFAVLLLRPRPRPKVGIGTPPKLDEALAH